MYRYDYLYDYQYDCSYDYHREYHYHYESNCKSNHDCHREYHCRYRYGSFQHAKELLSTFMVVHIFELRVLVLDTCAPPRGPGFDYFEHANFFHLHSLHLLRGAILFVFHFLIMLLLSAGGFCFLSYAATSEVLVCRRYPLSHFYLFVFCFCLIYFLIYTYAGIYFSILLYTYLFMCVVICLLIYY